METLNGILESAIPSAAGTSSAEATPAAVTPSAATTGDGDAAESTPPYVFTALTPVHTRNIHELRRSLGIFSYENPKPKTKRKQHLTPKIVGKPVRVSKPKTPGSAGNRKRKKVVDVSSTPPVVEVSSTPPVVEVSSTPPVVEVSSTPPVVEVSSTPYVEIPSVVTPPVEERLRTYARRKASWDSAEKDVPLIDIQEESDQFFPHKQNSAKRRLDFEEESNENAAAKLKHQLPVVVHPRVSRRVISRSMCLISSQKIEPKFPEICKRKRIPRRRKLIIGRIPCFPRRLKKGRSYKRRRKSMLYLWSLILERKTAVRRGPKTKLVKKRQPDDHAQKSCPETSMDAITDGVRVVEMPAKDSLNGIDAVEGQIDDLLESVIQEFFHLDMKDEVNSLVKYKPKQKAAKVNLDTETMRVWNQLMMLEGADGESNQDEVKSEETWERERTKFRKWIDNFTTFMHMILGDRRFTPWKGSVVDSVVGVFLTQNVSDFLSSSAFMSLCARFPPKSLDKDYAECIVVEAESDDEKSIPYIVEEEEVVNRDNGRMLEEADVENNNQNDPMSKEAVVENHNQNDPISEVAVAENHIQVREGKTSPSRKKKSVSAKEKKKVEPAEWERLRKTYSTEGPRRKDRMDSVDWEAVRCATLEEVANTIKERGQHYIIAYRIQVFLKRLVTIHGSIDLEWLRNCPPDKVKDYLLDVEGLGLKSVECVRLLCLQNMAFPVDTNVGRIAVRLGWVPLQPLPDNLRLHLLEKYPIMDEIQKYLWPRLCNLDQPTLYELHYHLITFGKVFCTKRSPNCNACPLRADCKHFGSAFASSYTLPASKGESTTTSMVPISVNETKDNPSSPVVNKDVPLLGENCRPVTCDPIIEEPSTPESEPHVSPLRDIEDLWFDNDIEDNIPPIKLDSSAFVANVCSMMNEINQPIQQQSLALIALTPEAASIPLPKLKYASRLRTEHQVYELPDGHPLFRLLEFERREYDDPCPYLLAIWPESSKTPESQCKLQNSGGFCEESCACDGKSDTVKGSILIPCRTAMRGSFPLNGTYFQVNELFADDASSRQPIDVPRNWIWNLKRRTTYFGTSTTTILRGLSMDEIRKCFWSGFVCVRGFDRKCRAPRPLSSRFHRRGKKGVAADDE